MNIQKEDIDQVECEIVIKVKFPCDESVAKMLNPMIIENVLSRKEFREAVEKIKDDATRQVKSYLTLLIDNPFINFMKGL